MARRIFMASSEIHNSVAAHAPLAISGFTTLREIEGELVPRAFPTPDELPGAWRMNPRCLECGRPIATAARAALLVGPGRVVHRGRCFIRALLRANPELRPLAAAGAGSVLGRHPELPPSGAKGRRHGRDTPGRGAAGREPHRG